MITINRQTRKLLLSKSVEDVYIGLMRFREIDIKDEELVKMLKSKYQERNILAAYMLAKMPNVNLNSFLKKYGELYKEDSERPTRYEIKTLTNAIPSGLFYIVGEEHIIHVYRSICTVKMRYAEDAPFITL